MRRAIPRQFQHKALAGINDALKLAGRLNHPFSLALTRLHASILHQVRRDPRMVLECIDSAEMLAAEKRLSLSLDPRVLRGWAMLDPDGIAAAVASYRAAPTDSLPYAPGGRPYSFALFAEVLARSGDHEGGNTALADAVSVAKESGEAWWNAEIHRLRGLLMLAHGRIAESEAWLREAIQTAQRQQAKSLELRAATSLARLWRDQRKDVEARDLLAPLYGWFTEGLDTLDLKDAKALLAELSA